MDIIINHPVLGNIPLNEVYSFIQFDEDLSKYGRNMVEALVDKIKEQEAFIERIEVRINTLNDLIK